MVTYLVLLFHTLVEISGYYFGIKLPKHKSVVSVTWD